MILIQLFSLFLLCNTIFAFSVNPDDISEEDPIKLIVDSHKGYCFDVLVKLGKYSL